MKITFMTAIQVSVKELDEQDSLTANSLHFYEKGDVIDVTIVDEDKDSYHIQLNDGSVITHLHKEFVEVTE